MNAFNHFPFVSETELPRAARRAGLTMTNERGAADFFKQANVRPDRMMVFLVKDGSLTPARCDRVAFSYEGENFAIDADMTLTELCQFAMLGMDKVTTDAKGLPDTKALAARVNTLSKKVAAGDERSVSDLIAAALGYAASTAEGYLMLTGQKSWISLAQTRTDTIDVQSGALLAIEVNPTQH
jgi:hypothetical protein